VIEILHGIPTIEIFEYHKRIDLLFENISIKKMIAPVHNLHSEINKAYGASIIDNSVFVNLTINRFRNALFTFADVRLLFGELQDKLTQSKTLVISISGGTGNVVDYVHSIQFKAEKKIIESVKDWAIKNNKRIVLLYSVHPFHIKTGHIGELQMQLPKIVFTDNSFYTWLISDLVISLYSSSLWDARFLGANVFSPVRVNDGIFSESILSTIDHPTGDERLTDSLKRTLNKIESKANISIEERFYSRLQQAFKFDDINRVN
jgi:hypothetical protein